MDFDIGAAWDAVKDGTREFFEAAHEKTSSFHENYVSKIVPDLGKYGDEAKFVAEMVPGIAEYNAIKDGDWVGFAIAAGIDVTAIAAGVFTVGSGYAAVKGGTALAKTGVKVAAKEIAEAGTEKLVKEAVEAGIEKFAKEVVEAGVEKVAKEAVESGAEKLAKEAVEAGAEKVVKEAAEAGVEKITKEAAETSVERTVLKVGDKIETTRFSEYVDEIEKITNREMPPQQKKFLEKALNENDFCKLSPEATNAARRKFNNNKTTLIEAWEEMTGTAWPRYAEDILDESGNVVRMAGHPYDAHHIIELSTGGPNEWWNLHPARFPNEHQNGIHAVESLAKWIFG